MFQANISSLWQWFRGLFQKEALDQAQFAWPELDDASKGQSSIWDEVVQEHGLMLGE